MELLTRLIGPDNGDASVTQLCARAVILLGFGMVCIRVAGRKTLSQSSPLDIIVAIVVGSNLSRAMTGKAPFLSALAATLLLVVLHRALGMLTLRWNMLAKFIKAGPVELVRDGIVNEHALVRHAVSQDDLMAGLRLEQVEDLAKVKRACLEGGGKISVILV